MYLAKGLKEGGQIRVVAIASTEDAKSAHVGAWIRSREVRDPRPVLGKRMPPVTRLCITREFASLSPNMVHSLNRRSRCSRVAAVDVVGQSSNSLNRWHTTAGINWWQPAILTQRKLARTGRLLVWRQGTWTEASTDAISLSCE